MKILGMILIAFGLVDLAGSYMDFDLWGTIGIQLPEMLWKFSSYIEIGVGYFIMQLGSSDSDEEATETSESGDSPE